MLVYMAMCESLCRTSPLPSPEQKQTTLTYQPHLTAISFTLLGQSLWVLWPIFMLLWVRFQASGDVKPLTIEPPVIIAVRQGITSTMINS